MDILQVVTSYNPNLNQYSNENTPPLRNLNQLYYVNGPLRQYNSPKWNRTAVKNRKVDLSSVLVLVKQLGIQALFVQMFQVRPVLFSIALLVLVTITVYELPTFQNLSRQNKTEINAWRSFTYQATLHATEQTSVENWNVFISSFISRLLKLAKFSFTVISLLAG